MLLILYPFQAYCMYLMWPGTQLGGVRGIITHSSSRERRGWRPGTGPGRR